MLIVPCAVSVNMQDIFMFCVNTNRLNPLCIYVVFELPPEGLLLTSRDEKLSIVQGII